MLFKILNKVKHHRVKNLGDVVIYLYHDEFSRSSRKKLIKYLEYRGYDVKVKNTSFYLDDDCSIVGRKTILTIKVGL